MTVESQDPNFKAWPVFKKDNSGHARIMEEMGITDAQREELAHLMLIQKTHWVAVLERDEKRREALERLWSASKTRRHMDRTQGPNQEKYTGEQFGEADNMVDEAMEALDASDQDREVSQ